MELFRYFHEMVAKRRAQPTNDIVSVVANGSRGRQAARAVELLSYYFLLVVAGNETTRNAMTGRPARLHREPGRVAQAGAGSRAGRSGGGGDRALDHAGDPVLPDRDPGLRAARARRSAQGESLCLFYPSANRDEDVFDEPFRFRIDRRPNEHIGFGRGEHVCLGAHLARLELRCAFAQLRERLQARGARRPLDRVRSSFVGGIKRVPIRWRLAPA